MPSFRGVVTASVASGFTVGPFWVLVAHYEEEQRASEAKEQEYRGQIATLEDTVQAQQTTLVTTHRELSDVQADLLAAVQAKDQLDVKVQDLSTAADNTHKAHQKEMTALEAKYKKAWEAVQQIDKTVDDRVSAVLHTHSVTRTRLDDMTRLNKKITIELDQERRVRAEDTTKLQSSNDWLSDRLETMQHELKHAHSEKSKMTAYNTAARSNETYYTGLLDKEKKKVAELKTTKTQMEGSIRELNTRVNTQDGELATTRDELATAASATKELRQRLAVSESNVQMIEESRELGEEKFKTVCGKLSRRSELLHQITIGLRKKGMDLDEARWSEQQTREKLESTAAALAAANETIRLLRHELAAGALADLLGNTHLNFAQYDANPPELHTGIFTYPASPVVTTPEPVMPTTEAIQVETSEVGVQTLEAVPVAEEVQSPAIVHPVEAVKGVAEETTLVNEAIIPDVASTLPSTTTPTNASTATMSTTSGFQFNITIPCKTSGYIPPPPVKRVPAAPANKQEESENDSDDNLKTNSQSSEGASRPQTSSTQPTTVESTTTTGALGTAITQAPSVFQRTAASTAFSFKPQAALVPLATFAAPSTAVPTSPLASLPESSAAANAVDPESNNHVTDSEGDNIGEAPLEQEAAPNTPAAAADDDDIEYEEASVVHNDVYHEPIPQDEQTEANVAEEDFIDWGEDEVVEVAQQDEQDEALDNAAPADEDSTDSEPALEQDEEVDTPGSPDNTGDNDDVQRAEPQDEETRPEPKPYPRRYARQAGSTVLPTVPGPSFFTNTLTTTGLFGAMPQPHNPFLFNPTPADGSFSFNFANQVPARFAIPSATSSQSIQPSVPHAPATAHVATEQPETAPTADDDTTTDESEDGEADAVGESDDDLEEVVIDVPHGNGDVVIHLDEDEDENHEDEDAEGEGEDKVDEPADHATPGDEQPSVQLEIRPPPKPLPRRARHAAPASTAGPMTN